MAEKQRRISFLAKEEIACPLCVFSFKREELLSGGGRMNAGILTDELRRRYEETAKYGRIYPLIYPITVCPSCYYAAFPSDFGGLKASTVEGLMEKKSTRKEIISALFPTLSFERERGLEEGVASYLLAVQCYEHFPLTVAPTFKQALATLRGAWLCGDLHEGKPDQNYDKLQSILYGKASSLFNGVVEKETNGQETVSTITHFGPGIDQNFDYEGVLYLAGVLEYYHGHKKDDPMRALALEKAKVIVSRVVGLGRSSKEKPSEFLELARELFAKIKEELTGSTNDA